MRITFFKLHSLFGLNLFGILALLFFSGSLLVFILELETSLNKDIQLQSPATSQDAAFGQIFDNVSSFDPRLRPVFIERSKSRWVGDRVFARGRKGLKANIWTHPDTGEVLGESKLVLRGIVFQFHTSFMTGQRAGVVLASGFSIVLLGFVVTGVMTYRRFWRAFFTMPSGKMGARSWWAGLHQIMAAWLLPFMFLIAVTGIYYFSTATGLVSVNFPKADAVSARSSQYPDGFDGAALDRAVNVARNALPGLKITVVNLPFSARHGIVVFGYADELVQYARSNKITIDPVTFKVLGLERAADLNFWQRYAQVNTSIHFGTWGGFYSRILWLGLGLASTFLTFSGAMAYARRVANGPRAKGKNAAGRIWFGMGKFRWGLVLYSVVVVGLAILRFGIG